MSFDLNQLLQDLESTGLYYVFPGASETTVLDPGEIHAVTFGGLQKENPSQYQERALRAGVLLVLEPQSSATPNVYVGAMLPFAGPTTVFEVAIELGAEALVVSKTTVEASWFKTSLLKAYHTPYELMPWGTSPKRRVLTGPIPAKTWVYLNVYFTGIPPWTHAAVAECLEAGGFQVIDPTYGLSGVPADEWIIEEGGITLLFRSEEAVLAEDLVDLPGFDPAYTSGGQVWIEAATSDRLQGLPNVTDIVYWTKTGEAVVGSAGGAVGAAAGTAKAALGLTEDALKAFERLLKNIRRNAKVVLGVIAGVSSIAGGYWLYRKYKKSKGG